MLKVIKTYCSQELISYFGVELSEGNITDGLIIDELQTSKSLASQVLPGTYTDLLEAPFDRSGALDQLVEQAQELDMGY